MRSKPIPLIILPSLGELELAEGSKKNNVCKKKTPFYCLLFEFLKILAPLLCSLNISAFEDPCAFSKTSLLNILNRGSEATSACPVPHKDFMIESGYQYQKLKFKGDAQIGPSTSIRYGLYPDNEILAYLPNYISQNVFPRSGFLPLTLGYKHRFFYNEKLIIAGSVLITPPNGSKYFSNAKTAGSLLGIVNYNASEKFSWLVELGINSFSGPKFFGGRQFQAASLGLIASYNPTPKLALFAEIYGLSKTGHDEGLGYNGGIGMLYLVNPQCVLDLEYYPTLRGDFLGLASYYGAGISVLFV